MKALVYYGPGKRSWQDVPAPTLIGPTQFIARVATTTNCGTHFHILKGDVT
ncbi:MAG: alcohol dehydrogenase, partial [Rothia sp. (in: high G+C Gram-positive bacteria)]|nr:alcohol dehydrogenase [Rothia sp. (in: high G+C Gram-positive bacteria)]